MLEELMLGPITVTVGPQGAAHRSHGFYGSEKGGSTQRRQCKPPMLWLPETPEESGHHVERSPTLRMPPTMTKSVPWHRRATVRTSDEMPAIAALLARLRNRVQWYQQQLRKLQRTKSGR